jgi:hypothetical protein
MQAEKIFRCGCGESFIFWYGDSRAELARRAMKLVDHVHSCEGFAEFDRRGLVLAFERELFAWVQSCAMGEVT